SDVYKRQGLSIDGHVEGWFTDDTPGRFRAYGWNVIGPIDGHSVEAVDRAIAEARRQAVLSDGKPTLIVAKTIIGKGSPNKAGGHDVHGAPLGAAEVEATRQALGWTHAPFVIPENIYAGWTARARGAATRGDWQRRFEAYRAAFSAEAAEFERRMKGDLPTGWSERLAGVFTALAAREDAVATRKASQIALDHLAPLLPEFFGGSADLTGSNLTNFKGSKIAGRDTPGNHLSYGVREFGMAAIMNGIALHGGYLPYGGTFLTFADYSRNAIRMAALMKQRVIHVMTHDSIGLGEDGPTHQAVEQVPSLRLIPNLDVWRPADQLETAVAWAAAVERRDGPTLLALSRQNLPRVVSDTGRVADIRRGGYVLLDCDGKPELLILATGSETHLAVEAAKTLATEGRRVRVISMPSTTVFDRQDKTYRDAVIPCGMPRMAIEAAHPDFWRKYVGTRGDIVGVPTFGESAPAKAVYEHFGITVPAIVERAKR
ncbi:MAG: transketolase, partial [Anaerolineae bacterium]|nr:transketolase [Anaerolineae bacterium]